MDKVAVRKAWNTLKFHARIAWRKFCMVMCRVLIVLLLVVSVYWLMVKLLTMEHPKEVPTLKVEASEAVEPPVEEPQEELDRWGMTSEELEVVKRVVMTEARGESYLGQMAVVQCIRETAEVTDKTPYEVVMEKGQYGSPYDSYTDSVSDAVWAVLYNDERAVADNIRFFYAPGQVYSRWHEESLDFVCEIGGHRFFKTK